MNDRWTRLAPLTGVIAVVLVAITAFVGSPPDIEASGEEVVAFYTDDESARIAMSILFVLAALSLIFFAGALRLALRRSEAHGGLSAVAFAGGVILALGMLIFAGLNFSLADAAGSLDPAAAQALNVLRVDLLFPLTIGMATLLLASGIAIARGAALPAWLGWVAIVIGIAVVVAIVIGIAALTPTGFIAFLVGGVWILVVSIWLATTPATDEP